ncbi:Uncharacterised protein [Mycobacterium tuberculosis]|nr:Uncharacterised protein [Mycobacterium tuberculosis]
MTGVSASAVNAWSMPSAAPTHTSLVRDFWAVLNVP